MVFLRGPIITSTSDFEWSHSRSIHTCNYKASTNQHSEDSPTRKRVNLGEKESDFRKQHVWTIKTRAGVIIRASWSGPRFLKVIENRSHNWKAPTWTIYIQQLATWVFFVEPRSRNYRGKQNVPNQFKASFKCVYVWLVSIFIRWCEVIDINLSLWF